jgi:hypothetical protein
MKTFRITFKGRTKGAIGISYMMTDVFQGDTQKGAELSMYDKYEHIMQKLVVDITKETLLKELDRFTKSYIETALWSSCDDFDNPLDANYSVNDLALETLEKIIADCSKFQAENLAMFENGFTQAGHDFWLTRNHHGAGFWDGDYPENGNTLTAKSNEYGECDLYVGDDGMLYI